MRKKADVLVVVCVLTLVCVGGTAKVSKPSDDLKAAVRNALATDADDVKPFLRAWDKAAAKNKAEAENVLSGDIDEHKSLRVMLGDMQRLDTAPSLQEAQPVYSDKRGPKQDEPLVKPKRMKKLETMALETEEVFEYVAGKLHEYITERRIKATVTAAEGLLLYADQKKIEFSIYKSSPPNEPIQMKGPRLFYQEIFSLAASFQSLLGTLGSKLKMLVQDKPATAFDQLSGTASKIADVVSVLSSEQTARLSALQLKYIALANGTLAGYANSPVFWTEMDMTAKMAGYTGVTMTKTVMTIVTYLDCAAKTAVKKGKGHPKDCGHHLDEDDHDKWADFHFYNDQESGIDDLLPKIEKYRKGDQRPNYDEVLRALLENSNLRKHFPFLSLNSGEFSTVGVIQQAKSPSNDNGKGSQGNNNNGEKDPTGNSSLADIVAQHKKDLEDLNENRKKEIDAVLQKYEGKMKGLHENAVAQISAKVGEPDKKAEVESILDDIHRKMKVNCNHHEVEVDTSGLSDFLKNSVKGAEDSEGGGGGGDGGDDGDDDDQSRAIVGLHPAGSGVGYLANPEIQATKDKIEKALENLKSEELTLLENSLNDLKVMLDGEKMGKNSPKVWLNTLSKCKPHDMINNDDILSKLDSYMENIQKIATNSLKETTTVQASLRESYASVIKVVKPKDEVKSKGECEEGELKELKKIGDEAQRKYAEGKTNLRRYLDQFESIRTEMMDYLKELMKSAHAVVEENQDDCDYDEYVCRMNVVSTVMRLRGKLMEPAMNVVDTYMQFAVSYFNVPYDTFGHGAGRLCYKLEHNDKDCNLKSIEKHLLEDPSTKKVAAAKTTE